MNYFRDRYPQLDKLVEEQALEAANIGICISDPYLPGNPIIYCNGSFLRMTGYERDEVLGRNCRFLQGPDTDVSVIEKLSAGLRHSCEFTVLLKNYRKNKTAFWNELHLSPIKDKNGTLLFFIGFQNDVTDRVLLEESLKLSRTRQDELIEASGDFFWELDAKGIFSYVSNKIGRTTGFSPAEFYRQSLFDFLAKDESEDQKQLLEEILLSRKPFRSLKLNLVTKNGKTAWIRLSGTPRFDASTHEFSGFIGSGGDITDEQSRLMDTYRLSSLGQVAAEIAHEIANPMTIIDWHAETIQRALGAVEKDPAHIQNSLDKIRKMVVRTQRIITGAKAMAKNGSNDLYEMTEMKELITDSIELCTGKIKLSDVKVEVSVLPVELSFQCKPIQLSQVMVNLISNACDVLGTLPESEGTRWIKIEVKRVESQVEIRFSNAGKNASATLDVALKTPFQSGKSGKGGTGIGLHLIKKILKAHHGVIDVDPLTLNTCLVILLPLTQPNLQREEAA